MSFWRRVHLWAWWVRVPLKLAAFTFVVLVVLYPKVWLLPRWVGRLHDLDRTLEPEHPGLAEFETAVRARVEDVATEKDLLKVVQQVVYQRIPYAWDWDVWGVVDYIPTTDEVLRAGCEDCDGRAVVAASLLRRLGREAWLASDLLHVWVVTPQGETMSPGAGEKTIQSGPEGTRLRVTTQTAVNLNRGLLFGISVFPLLRQLIILAALCGLTMQPRSSVFRRCAGCLLMLAALAVLHDGGRAAAWDGGATAWVGYGLAVAGWLLLAIRAGGRHSSATQPG